MYSTFLQVSVVLYETHPRLDLIYGEEFYRISALVHSVALAPNQNECRNAITIYHPQGCSDLFCWLNAVKCTKHELYDAV